jgi:hypothetical protein
MNNNKTIEVKFGGFSTLLTIVFVVLKLTGVITWSWWLVFLPMIISWGLFFLILLFVGAITILAIIFG